MAIELKLTADTAKELAAHVNDIAAWVGGQPTVAISADTTKPEQLPEVKAEPEAKAEPEVKAEPEEKPKTRRKRRTKAEIEAEKAAEEEAKPEPEPEANSETLTYQEHIRPLMTELVNQPDGGREKAMEILKSFGVANGRDLKESDLADVKKQAEAALTELKENEEDFI